MQRGEREERGRKREERGTGEAKEGKKEGEEPTRSRTPSKATPTKPQNNHTPTQTANRGRRWPAQISHRRAITEERTILVSHSLSAKTCSNSRQPPALRTKAQEGGRKAKQSDMGMRHNAALQGAPLPPQGGRAQTENHQPATPTQQPEQPQPPTPRPSCNRTPPSRGGEQETSWSKGQLSCR